MTVSNTICLLIITVETQTPCAANVAIATTSPNQISVGKLKKGKDATP